jgi:hypothetical protein
MSGQVVWINKPPFFDAMVRQHHAFDFMEPLIKQNPIPKVIALLLVSIAAAWLLVSFDTSALARMDSMSAADYIQSQRELHHHSIIFHFIAALIMGGFYLGAMEFLAYAIGLCFPKKPAA